MYVFLVGSPNTVEYTVVQFAIESKNFFKKKILLSYLPIFHFRKPYITVSILQYFLCGQMKRISFWALCQFILSMSLFLFKNYRVIYVLRDLKCSLMTSDSL